VVVAVVAVEEAVASLLNEAVDPVVLEVLEVEVKDSTDLRLLETLEVPVVYVPDIQTELVHPELLVVLEVALVTLEVTVAQ
jgi:hypothetical protein